MKLSPLPRIVKMMMIPASLKRAGQRVATDRASRRKPGRVGLPTACRPDV
jgi:hypothetical protein